MENETFNSSIVVSGLSTMDIIIGTTYITLAIIFIILHLLCVYLIWTDKDMQTPTYAFMINLGVADCLELVTIGIYAGTVILTKWQNQMVARFAAFILLAAFYANSVLFVFAAFSRWIALTRPHLDHVIFRRNMMWSLQVGPWLALGIVWFCLTVIFPSGPPLVFSPEIYTWYFNNDLVVERFFDWWNFGFDFCCTILEMSFNILSIAWVRNTRKQVQTVSTSANRRSEVKLLIQCVILGCVYAAAYLTHTIIFLLQLESLAVCIMFQAVWTLNHSINPIVYFAVNKKLRQRAFKIITLGKFKGGTQVSPVQFATQTHD